MNGFIKFAISLLVILAIGVAFFKSDDLFGDTERADNDRDAIQGTWAVTYAESNGIPAPAGMFDHSFITFTGEDIVIQDRQGSFKIRPSRGHGRIDVSYGLRTDRGIYLLDGDHLILCFHTNGGRPDDFETSPHSYLTLFELTRY